MDALGHFWVKQQKILSMKKKQRSVFSSMFLVKYDSIGISFNSKDTSMSVKKQDKKITQESNREKDIDKTMRDERSHDLK